MQFIPTKQAAENLLNQFISDSLNDYTAKRNFDFGPENRSNVSCLSPYIRHKVLSEKYVIEKVMQSNPEAIESKFIQEVLWRTYWKGYLEGRQEIWTDCRESISTLKQHIEDNKVLNSAYQTAINAQTGIECFDYWVRELIETGYLHNHARMWFASIWVFTLGLPWQLGADFFYYHLLDADPASNTLSWRWVAGLHTKGKYYFASEDNIKKYTHNRFKQNNQLIQSDPVIVNKILQQEKKHYEFKQPEWADNNYPPKNYTLLLHEENMFPEIGNCMPDNIIIYHQNNENIKSPAALTFAKSLMEDSIKYLSGKARFKLKVAETSSQIYDYCNSIGVSNLYMPFCPTGPIKDSLSRYRSDKIADNILITEVVDAWELNLYPMASRGFFDFYHKSTKYLNKALIRA